MIKINFSLFILILFIACVFVLVYFKYNYNDMTYAKSDIDNSYYLVRNVNDKQQAANTLAKIKKNLIDLSDHLYSNNTDKEYTQYVDRLNQKVKNIIFVESTHDSIYTSYSINKGEQIVFCLRSRKLFNSLHDLNLMMYVALHEISHVACPIYDNHGPLFKKIFSFILNHAEVINIYKRKNYRENPEEYCGLIISEQM